MESVKFHQLYYRELGLGPMLAVTRKYFSGYSKDLV